MKKFIPLILALALVLSLSVPAFAIDERDVEVTFTYDIPEPKYYIIIPSSIELSLNGPVNLPVTAEGVASLEGRKIAISVSDALFGIITYDHQERSDMLIVQNEQATDPYCAALGYVIDGQVGTIQYKDSGIGRTLLRFTEEETQNLSFKMYLGYYEDDNHDFDFPAWGALKPSMIYPNSKYTGWVTFGIKVEW